MVEIGAQLEMPMRTHTDNMARVAIRRRRRRNFIFDPKCTIQHISDTTLDIRV